MGKQREALARFGEKQEWDWNKLQPQKDFLTSTATYTMYSGGFGTGKTSVLCAKIIGLLLMIPNNLGFLGRLDGKALKQTTVKVLEEMLDPRFVQSKNDQIGLLKIKPEYGGSYLVYGDFKDLNDLKNHPLGFFAIDQCEEIEQEVWDFLVGRNRRRIPIVDLHSGLLQYQVTSTKKKCVTPDGRHLALGRVEQCKICHTALPAFNDDVDEKGDVCWDLIVHPRYGFGVCNPEDPGHWIYQNFGGFPGIGKEVSVGTDEYVGFHATTYQGMQAGFVDKKYVNDLEKRYTHVPLMFDRYLLGKWVIAEGLVYPTFDRQVHVLNKYAVRIDGSPLIPEHLPVFEYIDHGVTAPTAVGWYVVEKCDCGCNKHNVYLIASHTVAGQGIKYHSKAIKQKRKELNRTVQMTTLDAQCFSKIYSKSSVKDTDEENLYSIADDYFANDIFVLKSQKDWDTGWQAINDLLTIDPYHMHPVTGEMGAPHFFVFSDCKEVIDEFTSYKWKKRKPGQPAKDEPQDGGDDHMDGLNGALGGRPELQISLPEKQDTRNLFQKELANEAERLFGLAEDLYDETPTVSFMGY